MNVELNEGEARLILDYLSRPAAERVSPFHAGIRASVKRKVREALVDAAQATADADLVLGFLADYLALERQDASPDDVLRLRTGWPDTRINAALRSLGLVLPSGIWRQGWTETVRVSR